MITKQDYYRRKDAKDAERAKKLAENWKTKTKDPLLWFTGILALATVGLVWMAYETDQTLRATLATQKLEQRPWIFVSNAKIRPRANGQSSSATLVFDLELTNTGKIPPSAVAVKINIVPHIHENQNWVVGVQELCNETTERIRRDAREWGAKFTVIPGDKAIQVVAIDAAIDPIINPHLVGCVHYIWLLEDKAHTTGFAAPLEVDQGSIRTSGVIYTVDPN